MQKKMEDVKPVSRSAEIQMGWTALVEAFNNAWLGLSMSAEEVMIYTGVSARAFVAAGWLREDGRRYWPDGQMLVDLERKAQPDPDVHVNTFPFPHVVPAPTEMAPARSAESEPSNHSTGAARAGVAPASAAVGRWDQAGGVRKEMEDMIQALRIVCKETETHLVALIYGQVKAGRSDAEMVGVGNGISHLRRLAGDLYTKLSDLEYTHGQTLEACRKSKIA